MAEHLGVYVLGSAGDAERSLVRSHLPECARCRAELELLAPLADLLDLVPPELVPEVASARSRRLVPRRPVRAWQVVTATAVTAAAAGLAGGFWLLPRGSGAVPTAVTLSAANPVTHVTATAALTGTSWGTSIRVEADGLPLNELCWLVVRSRDGSTEVTGYWDPWSTGPVSVPASAAWRPSDIAGVQVVTKAGVLIDITR